MLYLRVESLKVFLQKEMGFSLFYSFFCNRIPAMVCSEANVKTMKSLSKSGLTITCALDKYHLISIKDCLASSYHLKLLSFFSILFTYFTTLAKLVMSLLKKFTLPRKEWISFLFLGRPISYMVTTLSGSILIPFSKIMWPRRFPSSMAKLDSSGLREMPNFLHSRKTFLRCCKWS
jgi:hypothetical protein